MFSRLQLSFWRLTTWNQSLLSTRPRSVAFYAKAYYSSIHEKALGVSAVLAVIKWLTPTATTPVQIKQKRPARGVPLSLEKLTGIRSNQLLNFDECEKSLPATTSGRRISQGEILAKIHTTFSKTWSMMSCKRFCAWNRNAPVGWLRNLNLPSAKLGWIGFPYGFMSENGNTNPKYLFIMLFHFIKYVRHNLTETRPSLHHKCMVVVTYFAEHAAVLD